MKTEKKTVDHMQLLQQAVALHRSGQLAESAAIYRKLLKSFPKNAALLTNLSIIVMQQGNFVEGVRLIEKSLQIDSKQANAHTNRGIGLHFLNRFEHALQSHNRAIALNPDYAEAYYNRGITLNALKRFEDALLSYDRAIALLPRYPQAYSNRGVALYELQRYDEAVQSYDQAIALNPHFAEAYSNRGNALSSLKKLQEAVQSYEQAIAINPHYAEAFSYRGNVLSSLKKPQEALDSFDCALKLNPNYAEAWVNRGNAQFELQRYEEALHSYEQAITLNPSFAQAYYNNGNVLLALKRPQEALHGYAIALSLEPNNAEAHCNRGNVLNELKQYAEALHSYGQALALNPNHAYAHVNRGNTLFDLKRLDEALQSYDQAIAVDVDFAEAYWNKALLKILQADYKEGWKLFEWRWKKDSGSAIARNFAQPVWLGEQPLADKTILVYPEQGLGDCIQFCRYLPLLEQMGTQVVLEMFQPLLALMATLKGNFTIIETGQPLPDFDYCCPIMSLPLAFNTTVETIPAATPYLYADTQKQQFWRDHLGEKAKPRVGLVWSGSTTHKKDSSRSIPLSLFGPLLQLPFEFHALQKEIRPDDAAFIKENGGLTTHQEALSDFSDTAALVAEMDWIISVDTSVAHLAGALGKELWLLLPFVPDYRWFLDREDSPWYPSATLFRQPCHDDWQSVMEALNTKFLSKLKGI